MEDLDEISNDVGWSGGHMGNTDAGSVGHREMTKPLDFRSR